MKEYTVKAFESAVNWDEVPKAEITSYVWDDAYTPEAFAQLAYVKGDRFVIRMQCRESAPIARYKNYNDPVYTDSCLEFFADWANAGKYVNMEMNSLGTLLSCCGPDRHDRTPVRDLLGGRIFKVTPSREGDFWCVTGEIPVAAICEIYGCGPEIFRPGYSFRANFYKCGDKTETVHYGSWNPIGTEKPDFHRPEFFGKLVIAE